MYAVTLTQHIQHTTQQHTLTHTHTVIEVEYQNEMAQFTITNESGALRDFSDLQVVCVAGLQ